MNISPLVENWLLEGPAWVQFRAYSDLIPRSVNPEVLPGLHQLVLQEAGVQSILGELRAWPEPNLNSHKAAGHPLHKMVFLADLGLTVEDAGIPALVDRILAAAAQEGPFQIKMAISAHYGGTGEDKLAWALCDSPSIVYTLAKFGLRDHPAVQKAAEFLSNLVRENGWPCAVSPVLGKFRGPGRKEDACPFANLVMLQALAQFPDRRDSPATRRGVESALSTWAQRKEQHPYLFYMGTDFCKLKAPLVWYDLLHVLDVLSQFRWLFEDPRYQEMVSLLAHKADAQGRFTPESVWMAYKDWEFGQKKIPSRWLTLLAWRILLK